MKDKGTKRQQNGQTDGLEWAQQTCEEQIEKFFRDLAGAPGEKPARCTVRLAHPPKDYLSGDDEREWLGGTGVLVKCAGKHWLLTAAHCLHERKRPHETLSEMEFFIVTARSQPTAGCVAQGLRGEAAIVHGGRNLSNREGPDIAWIAIDEEKANWIENRTFGLFYNLDKQRGGGKANGQFYLSGFVGEDDLIIEGHGEKALCQRTWPVWPVEVAGVQGNGVPFEWGIEESKDWQYRDMIVDGLDLRGYRIPSHAAASPQWLAGKWHEDLKGMSGAGLWMCFKTDDAEDIEWILSGIAYYQDERRSDGYKVVRFHGIHSIAKRIREQARV